MHLRRFMVDRVPEYADRIKTAVTDPIGREGGKAGQLASWVGLSSFGTSAFCFTGTQGWSGKCYDLDLAQNSRTIRVRNRCPAPSIGSIHGTNNSTDPQTSRYRHQLEPSSNPHCVTRAQTMFEIIDFCLKYHTVQRVDREIFKYLHGVQKDHWNGKPKNNLSPLQRTSIWVLKREEL